jgi:hypothetical protein
MNAASTLTAASTSDRPVVGTEPPIVTDTLRVERSRHLGLWILGSICAVAATGAVVFGVHAATGPATPAPAPTAPLSSSSLSSSSSLDRAESAHGTSGAIVDGLATAGGAAAAANRPEATHGGPGSISVATS